MIIDIDDFKGTVFSLLSLWSYFLWGIKEVYKLLWWTWILADVSFLQHYTPSHEHVASHESWQMKKLGTYPGREDAEWECYWWKVFLQVDLWCDSSLFEMYTRACIDGATLFFMTGVLIYLLCCFCFFPLSFNGQIIHYEIVISGCYHILKAKKYLEMERDDKHFVSIISVVRNGLPPLCSGLIRHDNQGQPTILAKLNRNFTMYHSRM